MIKWFLNKNKLITYLIIFLVITVLFLMNYIRLITSELAIGRSGKYTFHLIMEATGAYTILLLLPIVIWFINKFPITRKNMASHIPLHILASLVFGVSHTLLMYFSRMFIFCLFNIGTYDYGKIIYRFPMEYSHQLFTYWTVYVCIFFFKYLKNSQEQKLKTIQLEQQLTKVRLHALQMQLHPHFLFNTLNMISSTMYEDTRTADHMITNLSDLLRITLDQKESEEHSLEKELEELELYIEIMKARYKNNLKIEIHIEKDTLNALVPSFIFQPLVENSIKYSMDNLKSAEIHISSHKENNTLKLIIRDNGPGISGNPDMIIKTGMGLSNTAERLDKLYKNDHRFHLQNIDKGGLQVEIHIPFQLSIMEE